MTDTRQYTQPAPRYRMLEEIHYGWQDLALFPAFTRGPLTRY